MTNAKHQTFDVAVVGARAAGAALGIHLASAGLRVALIDRATFPSDTLSTHVVYPNTLARFEDLGVLDDILAHKPPPLYTSWHHEGRMWVAPHEPVRGRDWAICVRRITLDAIMVQRASAAGAALFEGTTVTGLLGGGEAGDPVRGVLARRGDQTLEIHAPIVVGADGVNSTVARLVGAPKTKVMPTETMLYFAYWTGARTRNTQDFFFDTPWICAHFPADDDHHVVTMNGPVSLRPSIKDMEAFYRDRIAAIPALAARLEGATKVSRVMGTTQLEGFYRRHVGPGWALVGDAAHFKHPAGAQGIGDALHAAAVLADGVVAGDWMTAYPLWREQESREFYAFCRHLAELPTDAGMRRIMDACIGDATLARRVVDIWARRTRPWTEVIPFVPGMAQITGESVESVLSEIEASPLAESVAV